MQVVTLFRTLTHHLNTCSLTNILRSKLEHLATKKAFAPAQISWYKPVSKMSMLIRINISLDQVRSAFIGMVNSLFQMGLFLFWFLGEFVMFTVHSVFAFSVHSSENIHREGDPLTATRPSTVGCSKAGVKQTAGQIHIKDSPTC